jgi:hypothetical protein
MDPTAAFAPIGRATAGRRGQEMESRKRIQIWR